MKKHLLWMLLAGMLLPHLAQAQSQRAVCMEKCMSEPLPNERHRQLEAKLKKIQEKKAATSDPKAIKQLDEEEEDEQDKFAAYQEKSCKYICSALSE